ncbi:MAG: hypothetical protein M1837_004579 [Sclerophora amabilis]|nr:MAG: hypothetical protein M1837_004579 [Sclerophora amabilis]
MSDFGGSKTFAYQQDQSMLLQNIDSIKSEAEKLLQQHKRMSEQQKSMLTRVNTVEQYAMENRRIHILYHEIRSRFISVVKRDWFDSETMSDHGIIESRNESTPWGDPLVDAQLYHDAMRHDSDTYLRIYGVSVSRVITDIGKMPVALSMIARRGTFVAKHGDLPPHLADCWGKWHQALADARFEVDVAPSESHDSLTPKERQMNVAYQELVQAFAKHEDDLAPAIDDDILGSSDTEN